MKNKIIYSKTALQDLDDIDTYITQELQSPQAAYNTIKAIFKTIDILESFAESGKKLIFSHNLDSGYRYLSIKNYTVFYRTDKNKIYIDRILYAKRDFPNIFKA